MKKMKMYVEGFDENDEYIDAIGEKWKTAHFVYADGDLESMTGYDIVGYSSDDVFDFVNDREEEVIAVLPSGKEVEALLFFWHEKPYNKKAKYYMKEDPIYNCHGRLVAKDDKFAIEIARKKYIQKSSIN